jgi:hypothetical protein
MFIESLMDNSIFKIILAFCTIVGAFLAIFALIPATRTKFFPKGNNKVKKQRIIGTNNFQAGRNINMEKSIKDSVDYQQPLSVGSQVIKGDNNKQAGDNINA